MLAVGISIVVVAVVISLLGAIWVGVPLVIAGLILAGVAFARGARRSEPAEPPT